VLGRQSIGVTAQRPERVKAPPSSIAVLPFADLSPDHALEFFCDGIAEEITNALTRLPGIRVVAPGSAFRFRSTDGDRSDVSAALNVGSVLEGTVRAVGNSLRVVSRLINPADGRVRWSHRFDRNLDDVFAVQDEIAEATVRALGAGEGGDVPGAGVLPVAASAHDIEAYTLYLKGRHYWNRRNAAALQKSTALFEAAIERDPQYAEAYAGLAEAHATLGLYGCVAPQDSMPRALRAANHAIKLLDTLSSPFATAACIAAVYDWNWKESERQYARAIELNPAHPSAHHWYGINYLVPLGRFAEAATELQKAVDADPLSMPIRVSVGMYHYFARRYADAERELRDSFELDAGTVIGRVFLALSLVEIGRVHDALHELETAQQLGGSYEAVAATGYALARAGHADGARARADELVAAAKDHYIPPSLTAQIYAALGETSKALDWLEKASDARAPDLAWLRVRPVFDQLRAEGRFGALIGRLGL
jgi:serine/threonine-protein kinase